MSFFKKISQKIKETGIADKIKQKLTEDEEEKRRQAAAAAAAAQKAREEKEEREKLYPMTSALRAYLTESSVLNDVTFLNFALTPAECQQHRLGVQELQHIAEAERVAPGLAQLRRHLTLTAGQSAAYFWTVYFMLITQVVDRHRRVPYAFRAPPPPQPPASPAAGLPRALHFDSRGTILSALGVSPTPGRLSAGTLEEFPYDTPFPLKQKQQQQKQQKQLEATEATTTTTTTKAAVAAEAKAKAEAKEEEVSAPVGLAEAARTALRLSCVEEAVPMSLLRRIRGCGVSAEERAKVWCGFIGVRDFLDEQPKYPSSVRARAFGENIGVGVRVEVRENVLFGAEGGRYSQEDYAEVLTAAQLREVREALYMFAAEYGPEAHFPFLPDLLCLLRCGGLGASEAYTAAALLVARCHTRGGGLFPAGRAAQAAECERFAACVGECAPMVARRMRVGGLDPGLLAQRWFARLFVGVLPIPTVLHILDCFFADRSRAVLFRVALALLQLSPQSSSSSSSSSLLQQQQAKMKISDVTKFAPEANGKVCPDTIAPVDLLRTAYSIPVTAVAAAAASASATITTTTTTSLSTSSVGEDNSGGGNSSSSSSSSNGSSAFLCDTEDFPDLSRASAPDHLLPSSRALSLASKGTSDVSGTSSSTSSACEGVLGQEQFRKIFCAWLPRGTRVMTRKKLFATRRDGFSLSHLLRLCEGVSPVLIVVRSRAGNIFGAFITAELAKTGDRYAGTGESFVFALTPEPVRYPWSKRNVYFLSVGPRSLVVGGGGLGAALELDDELCLGASFRSATFENDPLDGGRTEFVVEELEVFGFSHGEGDGNGGSGPNGGSDDDDENY